MPSTRSASIRAEPARKIQRRLRSITSGVKRVDQIIQKMPFILNPYNTALDLTTKEGRKPFESGTKGLSDDLKLKGGKKNLMTLEN